MPTYTYMHTTCMSILTVCLHICICKLNVYLYIRMLSYIYVYTLYPYMYTIDQLRKELLGQKFAY